MTRIAAFDVFGEVSIHYGHTLPQNNEGTGVIVHPVSSDLLRIWADQLHDT